MYLTLRISREKHGSKNPLPFPYSLSSANFAVLRGNGEIHKRGGNLGVHPSYAPARRQRTFLPSAGGTLPAEVQRKTPRPLGANTLTQFEYPAQPVQRKEPLVRGELADAVRAPRSAGAEKTPARTGRIADATRVPQ